MSKRFVYILIAEEGCNIVATETSIKKIVDKFGKDLELLSYQHMNRLVRPTKEEGGEVQFKSKNGIRYKIAARRVQ